MRSNPILQAISTWFSRNFSDPAALGLFFTIVVIIVLLEFFGNILAPLLVSIIVAYLLNSIVRLFEQWRMPHLIAVTLVFLLFLGLVGVFLLVVLPLLWRELGSLVREMPAAIDKVQHLFRDWSDRYPLITQHVEFTQASDFIKEQISKWGHWVFSFSLSSLSNIIEWVLYMVLVPILIFFLLKDDRNLLAWTTQFLPSDRSLVTVVGQEVHKQIGLYIRGRVIEIVIISLITWITFWILHMPYAGLLGVCVGLSAIVPYIGAVLVTIPVVVIALFQWGLEPAFFYLMVAYLIIVIFDSNVLTPLLFSGVMNLHPIAIILSVLIFGGLWGFWGVFFAIPLMTVAKAILEAWPRKA
ncbi:MAG TPA: AI-2E family transporter [Coxiellaceae bacterium]|nr:AI-2E family transporter [Coxiellaceae bacterium]